MPQLSDELYLAQLTWLVTHDEAFLIEFGDTLHIAEIAVAEVAWLIEQATTFHQKHGGVITEEAIGTLLEATPGRKGFDKEAVLESYEEAIPVAGNAMRSFLVEHTRSWAQRRKLESLTDQLSLLLADGDIEAAKDLVAAGGADIVALADTEGPGDSLIDDITGFWAGIEERYGTTSIQSNAIPTGLKTIDRALFGGLRPRELGVFVGAPNVGKSQFLCHVARNAYLQGYNVVYYTLEMSSLLIRERIWAGIIKVPALQFEARAEEALPALKQFRDEQFKEFEGSPPTIYVKQYPTKTASVATLRGHLRLLSKDGFAPDLVCVDYGDFLTSTRHYNARHEEIAYVFEDLRGLGAELDVPIWTASQTNREGSDRSEVKAKHIADSWDKAKIADFIIGAGTDERLRAQNEMDIHFLKVRNGELPGPFKMATEFEYGKYYDLGDGSEFASYYNPLTKLMEDDDAA